MSSHNESKQKQGNQDQGNQDQRSYYGCYMANHEKFYRWQCKKFSNESDATKFAVEQANKYDSPFTMLIDGFDHIPDVFHSFFIERNLRRMTKVDILRK